MLASAFATYEPMPVVPPVKATTSGGPFGSSAMAERIMLRFGISMKDLLSMESPYWKNDL